MPAITAALSVSAGRLRAGIGHRRMLRSAQDACGRRHRTIASVSAGCLRSPQYLRSAQNARGHRSSSSVSAGWPRSPYYIRSAQDARGHRSSSSVRAGCPRSQQLLFGQRRMPAVPYRSAQSPQLLFGQRRMPMATAALSISAVCLRLQQHLFRMAVVTVALASDGHRKMPAFAKNIYSRARHYTIQPLSYGAGRTWLNVLCG